MKTLNTLIKYHKQQLDELRRALTALENKKASLLEAIEKLKGELLREIEIAKEQPEMSHFFGDFAQRIRVREETFRSEIAVLDQQMETMREGVRIKFGELKTFEIAKENHLKREKEKRGKREMEQMDEIALQQFMRKEESGSS